MFRPLTARLVPVLAGLFLVVSGLRAEEPKPAAPTPEQLKTWVQELGDQEFEKRNKARQKLLDAGTAALADIKAAQSSQDPEIRRAATEIAGKLQWLALPKDINYLKLFPDESLISLRFTAVDKTAVAMRQTAIARLLDGPDLKPIVDEIWKKAQAEGGPDGSANLEKVLKFARQIKGQIAGSVWGLNFREPGGIGAALVVELPAEGAEKLYRDFLAESKLFAGGTESNEGGLMVLSGPRPEGLPPGFDIPTGAIALAGRHMILTPNLTSLKKIAAGLTQPEAGNLADATNFKKLNEHLGATPDMLLTVNMQAYLRFLGTTAGPQAAEMLGKMGYDGLEWFAWSAAVKDGGFEERFVIMGNEKAGAAQKLWNMSWASGRPLKEKLALAPAEAVAVATNYVEGAAVFEFITGYLKQFAELQGGMGAPMPDLPQKLTELEGKLGLKFADLAGCVRGDAVAWAVLTPEEGMQALPDFGVSIECVDETQAKKLAESMYTLLDKAPAMLKGLAAAPAVPDGDPKPEPKEEPKPASGAVKVERDGRVYFTESSDSEMVKGVPARQTLPYRLSWAAHGNRLLLASSAPYLNRRISQLEKNTPGADPARFLPAGTKTEEIKSLFAVDIAALLEIGSKLGLPILAAQLEKEPLLQEKLAALAQKPGAFKTIPPLSVTAGVPKDGMTVSIIRGPVPYLPTAFLGGMGMGWMNAQKRRAAAAEGAVPPPAPPGF